MRNKKVKRNFIPNTQDHQTKSTLYLIPKSHTLRLRACAISDYKLAINIF